MKKYQAIFPLSVLSLSYFLVSCSPERARTLSLAAEQFRDQALQCITSIDEMRQREIAPTARSQTQIAQDFGSTIVELDLAGGVVTPEMIDFAVDPNAVDSSISDRAWDEFVLEMQNQYSTFASIYDELERGSYLAAEAVEESLEYAVDLTAQMAAFSKIIQESGPQLIQYRSDLGAELTLLNREYNSQKSIGASSFELQTIRDQASSQYFRLEEIKSEEDELLRQTLLPCVQASQLGTEVTQLIRTYDDIDFDLLTSIIAQVTSSVGNLIGSDLTGISNRLNSVINDIQSDEELNQAFQIAFEQINGPVQDRNGPIVLVPNIDNEVIAVEYFHNSRLLDLMADLSERESNVEISYLSD